MNFYSVQDFLREIFAKFIQQLLMKIVITCSESGVNATSSDSTIEVLTSEVRNHSPKRWALYYKPDSFLKDGKL